jgi:acetyl esterase/lipase
VIVARKHNRGFPSRLIVAMTLSTMRPISLLAGLLFVAATSGQSVSTNLPYASPAHERQVLDVYTPPNAKNLPVVFWIHGGGWQTGDKTSVQEKPALSLYPRITDSCPPSTWARSLAMWRGHSAGCI